MPSKNPAWTYPSCETTLRIHQHTSIDCICSAQRVSCPMPSQYQCMFYKLDSPRPVPFWQDYGTSPVVNHHVQRTVVCSNRMHIYSMQLPHGSHLFAPACNINACMRSLLYKAAWILDLVFFCRVSYSPANWLSIGQMERAAHLKSRLVIIQPKF